MTVLKDSYSREIDYLRVSVTDRCNMRCIYCAPARGVVPSKHRDILRYEEIIRIVRIAAGLGVRKVRLTGGEPLARRNITFLISSLKEIGGIEDLSMTTNGALLERYAGRLADAGLNRINVSIDSLVPERYTSITRGGELGSVLRGLEAARSSGLKPIKINMVPIRGINDDEIGAFANLTMNDDLHVRFIEFMPAGDIDFWQPDRYVSTEEMKKVIEKDRPLTPVKVRRHGPSRYFRLEGAKGVIGFISALTHHFCGDCNRLRLTSDGKLRPCLFSETEIDLRSPLRSGTPDTEIERLLRLAIDVKPEGHGIQSQGPFTRAREEKRPMTRIGG